ncbi:hypothetical protein AVEN_23083-1 [Araneus ventricosus]|uniref:Uncharacterized protein n=1 Tax=Araneus ventricosus TaxID=182803 RepID=A0A4Y2R8I9_ARAVE|nr:hypothetical protein AVEN_23083-1 [Araneus ventricosus]
MKFLLDEVPKADESKSYSGHYKSKTGIKCSSLLRSIYKYTCLAGRKSRHLIVIPSNDCRPVPKIVLMFLHMEGEQSSPSSKKSISSRALSGRIVEKGILMLISKSGSKSFVRLSTDHRI